MVFVIFVISRPTQQYQVMNGNNNHQNDPVRDLVDDIIQKISTENDNVYISVSRITKITIVLNDFR